jgi:hypothetical protein
MNWSLRTLVCLLGLMAGCGLVLGLSKGQDAFGGKTNKEKGPKGDKGDPEEKAVWKTAEKSMKAPESERDKWLKELNKAFPGRLSAGTGADDYHQWFDLLAAGNAEWRAESVPFRQVGELFDRAAERLELGRVAVLRREEFVLYALRFLRPDSSPPWKPVDPVAEADKVFDKLDKDGSGFLEDYELTDRLRAAIDRIDRNRDGRIDREEYRAYFEGRVQSLIESAADPPDLSARLPADEPPAAVRYGRLPAGLPSWFETLDVDRDGQVALWEWRRAGLTITEFAAMDLDGDGLLTAKEYLRFVWLNRPRRDDPDMRVQKRESPTPKR